MIGGDLDDRHLVRVERAQKELSNGKLDLEELFTSEIVLSAISSEKVILNSFRQEEILALLPFSQNMLVMVCPGCIRQDNFEAFKKLVERVAIIPVLTAPYRIYRDPVSEFISSHNHISFYEFSFFRNVVLQLGTKNILCRHCVETQRNSAMTHVKKRKNFSKFKEYAERIEGNLVPFITPDFELLETVIEACKSGDMRQMKQLEDISDGIYSARTAQAFGAPILLRADKFDQLPEGVIDADSASNIVRSEMKKYALDGLGLRIPTNIRIEEYLDLLSDYRPAIGSVLENVTEGKNIVSMADVQKQVIRINSEIERIKGLRRSVVLDACVNFYKSHPQLVTTSLLMCALGLAGSLWGCAAAGGVQLTRSASKVLGGKKDIKAVKRLKQVAGRDLLPFANRLIASYVGTDLPTVSVLSLRRIIEGRAAPTCEQVDG